MDNIRTVENQVRMSPVLKWAGGKTQLLCAITELLPATYDTYYEPFIGGAALLLNIAPKKAVINDVNAQLVNLYCQIRDNTEEIISLVNDLDSRACTSEIYYEMRDKYNAKLQNEELDSECAAYMIWINKHCFNGLYRVNGKGMFNVPYNNKVQGQSISEENIRNIGEYLKQNDISILCGDFETACNTVAPGDFVYFDSPYVPEGETADFTSYTKNGFPYEEHVRLSNLFKRLDAQGTKVMLSNNDVPLVRELYSDYNIQHLDVKRMINSNASRRNGKEVLITNY